MFVSRHPNPLGGRIRLLWILAAVCAIVLWLRLSGQALLGSRYSPAPILCFVALAACGILLGVFYNLSAKYAKAIEDLVSEHAHLVHWTYDDTEWRQFVDAEWQAARGSLVRLPLRFTLLGLGGGVVLALWPTGSGTWPDRLLMPLMFAGGALGLSLAGMPLLGAAAWWKRSKRLERAGEFYVGKHGLYESGAYCSYTDWGSDWARLNKVEVESGTPAMVHFTIEEKVHQGTRTKHVRLPVPHGREKEVAVLKSLR